ncbi:MAG TPA: LAGLIDADG family homing endonuclease [archaeon]|nr:LAGLIDADG family homing endonuclease [archaeon]
MSAKVPIDKDELSRLYISEKKSTYAIAKIYSCDATVIQNRLRKYEIPIREPKKKIPLSKETLADLYENKCYSTYKIAKVLGIGRTTVWNNLANFGISRRPLKRVPLKYDTLYDMYVLRKMSLETIGKEVGLSHSVVLDKLRANKIETRSSGETNTIYEKSDFSGDLIEKSYLIGFRLGDLCCERDSSFTICIKSSTTKNAQLELMKSLFEKYGHYFFYDYDGTYSFQCNLNNTFSFLLPKVDKIEDWILQDDTYFLSFFAGYVDAEGTIKIYDNRARFRVGSYDRILLKTAYEKLLSLGIKCTYKLETKANHITQHQDFWRIGIARKASLFKLFSLLRPYMQHQDRLRDLDLAEANVIRRLNLVK